MIIDSHAHLDYPQLADDLPAVLARAGEAGVDRVIFWLPAIEEEALVPILERHQDLLDG